MPRVKRGVVARARRKKVLKQAKGYYGQRSRQLSRCETSRHSRPDSTPTGTDGKGNVNSGRCGSCASMRRPASTASPMVVSSLD